MPSLELIITAFLGILVLASFVSLKARVPYTLVLVFLGIALTAASASFYLAGSPLFSYTRQVILALRSLSDSLTASEGGASLFVGLIVPPLIFEAMMHIRSNDLESCNQTFLLACNCWRCHSDSRRRTCALEDCRAINLRFISFCRVDFAN